LSKSKDITMALKVLQAGIQPIGQYKGDANMLTLKGGELLTMTTGPAVTSTLGTSALGIMWLADEGGTLFGQVVGGSQGASTGGTQLGPHTATGSGLVTCWDKPGLYAVTLDAGDTTATTGLVLSNTTTAVAGAPLYVTPAGKLTPNSTAGTGNGGAAVAYFVEFSNDHGRVNTPGYLANPALTAASAATMAVFHFVGR
jgi:hypothetical protein